MKKQQIALVMGAAKGLGAAIALRLAEEGYTVVVHYHASETEAAKTLEAVRALSPKSSTVTADVRSEPAVREMIQQVIQQYGRIDVLVNTIGNFIYKPLAETTLDEWKDLMETNLQSAFLLAQSVIPVMQQQKYGRMVFFGCAGADRMVTRPHTTPYYIAKAGVVMLTKQLGAEYAPDGITVNCISPGILESSVAEANTPIKRKIPFTPVLNMISLLLEKDKEYINGANIEIADGWLV